MPQALKHQSSAPCACEQAAGDRSALELSSHACRRLRGSPSNEGHLTGTQLISALLCISLLLCGHVSITSPFSSACRALPVRPQACFQLQWRGTTRAARHRRCRVNRPNGRCVLALHQLCSSGCSHTCFAAGGGELHCSGTLQLTIMSVSNECQATPWSGDETRSFAPVSSVLSSVARLSSANLTHTHLTSVQLEPQALDQRASEPQAGEHRSRAWCACERTASACSALELSYACRRASVLAAEVSMLQAYRVQVHRHARQPQPAAT